MNKYISTLSDQICSKKSKLSKVKFGILVNLNMVNSMVMFHGFQSYLFVFPLSFGCHAAQAESRTLATSKMELFWGSSFVNGFYPLIFVTGNSILDVALVLDRTVISDIFASLKFQKIQRRCHNVATASGN